MKKSPPKCTVCVAAYRVDISWHHDCMWEAGVVFSRTGQWKLMMSSGSSESFTNGIMCTNTLTSREQDYVHKYIDFQSAAESKAY